MSERNPKQEGSNLIDCVPQAGPCPNECNQCYYNRPGAFFTDIGKPHMPTPEEVGNKIVRVNSGHDSNIDKQHVIYSTAHYPERFFNTSIPNVDFPAPVVLTINPGEEGNYADAWEVEGNLDNIMFVRYRVSPTNIPELEDALDHWARGFSVPTMLTFMRYYDAEPEGNDGQFEFRKSIRNEYWCPTREFILSHLTRYQDNTRLVEMCGTPDSAYCRDCRACETHYWQAKKRMAVRQMARCAS